MSLFELLENSPMFATTTAMLFGLIVGSFLNVVIHRLPKMMENGWRSECLALLEQPSPEEKKYNLVTPASHCPKCDHKIGALENIPVISYLSQGGKCRACRTKISARYPLVELLTAVLCGWCMHYFGFGVAAAAAIFLTFGLISLSAIDFDTQLLPDDITLPFLWFGLFINLFGVFATLEDAVIGAIAGYLSLWSIFWLFKLCTGKEGMGYGDFKLLAVLGAWLGWQALPIIIIASSLVGAVLGSAILVLSKQDKSQPFPFGPYLAVAGWLSLVGITAPLQKLIFPTVGL
jgi:leader peptidase (prepilin peptidase) / N-methyltransferase